MQGVPDPVGIVAAVTEKPLCFWQIIEQRCRAGVVAHLSSGHEEARRASVRVGDRMELGVHAAFRAPDEAAEVPSHGNW